MSTATDSKQSQSKPQKRKARFSFNLRLRARNEKEDSVSDNAHSVEISVNTESKKETTIQQEPEEKETVKMVVNLPFKIHSRPRFDSSDDDDDADDTNSAHNQGAVDNKMMTDSIKKMNQLKPLEIQPTDSWVSAASFDDSDDDQDGQSESDPVYKQPPNNRQGTLTRQRARLDVLKVIIHEEVEDRDGDEHHPQAPDVIDDKEDHWHQNVHSFYAAADIEDDHQSDSPAVSIYGAMVRHQTMNNLKV